MMQSTYALWLREYLSPFHTCYDNTALARNSHFPQSLSVATPLGLIRLSTAALILQGRIIALAANFCFPPEVVKKRTAPQGSEVTSSTASANGRCNSMASPVSAVSHLSTSSLPLRITGIALGCTLPTSAFASVVRNANRLSVVSPSFNFRTDVHSVQIPAKNPSGPSPPKVNQTGTEGVPARL